ncbi:hypothetical protein TNCV_2885341 [Trichonephila clavipes]|nr:hypothetical protein TNCV_2885341 [Trichonephila clavipes]
MDLLKFLSEVAEAIAASPSTNKITLTDGEENQQAVNEFKRSGLYPLNRKASNTVFSLQKRETTKTIALSPTPSENTILSIENSKRTEKENRSRLCLSPLHAYTMGVKYMTGWVSKNGTVGSHLKSEILGNILIGFNGAMFTTFLRIIIVLSGKMQSVYNGFITEILKPTGQRLGKIVSKKLFVKS